MKASHPGLIDRIVDIARAAGAVILPHFRSGTKVRLKEDSSPWTAADEAADELITRELRSLTPTIPVVSEEAAHQFEGKAPGPLFWLVDPLDGTREFVAGRDEFTVNIALIEAGVPILGVVSLPARGEIYAGTADHGAVLITPNGRESICCREIPPTGAVVAVSRSHGDLAADTALLGEARIAGRVEAGSALKFCLIARGAADLYPRAGRTMEWDTAAGQAVLQAAGGVVLAHRNGELTYGKAGFFNPPFVAGNASIRSGTRPFGSR